MSSKCPTYSTISQIFAADTIAHGFTVPQMVGIVCAGLATAQAECVVAGGPVALPCCAPRALHRRASDNAVRHPALCASVPPDNSPPERFDQAEPITAASVSSSSRRTGKDSRGEQGRRVSASRTTVLRDGAKVWRPRRAGYSIPHGAGLAAAGR